MKRGKIKTVKIFIASSVVEFKEERKELQGFEAELDRIYKGSDIDFEINISDLLPKNLSKEGKQAEYNIEICKSRFAFFLIGKSVGEHTREEFRVAKEHFIDVESPLIYTFFRYDITNPLVDESVIRFVEDDLKEGNEHYYTTFDHVDTIKLNIMAEIVRHPDIGGSIGFRDGFAQLNGENIVPLKNIPMYQRNDDLAALKEQYEALNEEYADITAQLSQNHDFAIISRAYEIGLQRNNLQEEIERREKKILDNYLSYVDKARYGSEINWREKKALECYNRGDYVAGDAILDDALWEREVAAADEIGDSVIQTVHEYISGKRTLISSMLSREVNEETSQRVVSIYEQITGFAEKYQTDLDVLYDYAQFLYDQRDYRKALDTATRLSRYYELQPEKGKDRQYDLLILIGRLYHTYKDNANAIRYYVRAGESISESDPELTLKKAWINQQIVMAHIMQMEYSEAETVNREILENLNPDGSRWEKEILAQAYKSQGRISNTCNRFDEAAGYYNDAVQLCRSIEDYEKDEDLMELLSAIYNNLGYLFSSKSTDYTTAESYYRQSLEIKHKLFSINPSRWASKYALAESNYSAILLKTGKSDEAVKSAETSYAIREGLYEADPGAFGLGFGVTCYRLAAAKLDNGDGKAALKFGKQAVDIIIPIYQKNPKASAEEMSIAYKRYAETLWDENDVLAEEFYEKMLQVETDNPELYNRRKITISGDHASYARFLFKAGNREEARKHFDIALKYLSEVVEKNDRLSERKEKLEQEISDLFKAS